jgi:hypothetical protein
MIAVQYSQILECVDQFWPHDEFSNFLQWKKLVLLNCHEQKKNYCSCGRDPSPVPILYIATFEAFNIKCVYLLHECMSQIIVSIYNLLLTTQETMNLIKR